MKALVLATLMLFAANFALATGSNIQRVSNTFSGATTGTVLILKPMASLSYSLPANSGAVLVLEKSTDGLNYQVQLTFTNTTGSGVIQNLNAASQNEYYRFRASAYTSGTPTAYLNELPYSAKGQKGRRLVLAATANAKVGGTAGWVVAAADNLALVTCPASQTAAKLIIPLNVLPVGAVLKSFNLVGQIESGGLTATVDADLRVMTAAAADVTDASITTMTQLSVAADTIMSYSNTEKVLAIPKAVLEDESYYLVLTVTTASATDIALQSVVLEYDQP